MARNYSAEYAARKERAAARGLSTAEARGHANLAKGQVPIWVRNTVAAVHDGRKPTAYAVQKFREMEDVDSRKGVIDALRKAKLIKPEEEHVFWSALLGS